MSEFANINLSIQGNRDGEPIHGYCKGAVSVYIDYETTIKIDAYQGKGETYCLRKESMITIENKGVVIWENSLNQLIDLITK